MRVDFFIVGAPKAGTTSLYHYLNQHPEIKMSSIKEPNYFSNDSIQKQKMYYSTPIIDTLLQYEKLFEDRLENQTLGEASVSYLFFKDVPKKIKDYNSKAKIIIILRDPVERSFSHYLMDCRLGLINVTFSDIFNKRNKNKQSELFYQQYIELSNYSSQVKRYYEIFEKKNILLIDYEDFINTTEEVLKQVFIFLDVDHIYKADTHKRHNINIAPRNRLIRFLYAKKFLRKIMKSVLSGSSVSNVKSLLFNANNQVWIDKNMEVTLRKYFKDGINELSNISGRDYSRWIK